MKTVKTNQIENRFLGARLSGMAMAILALGVMSSCTKSEPDESGNRDRRTSIIPMATVQPTTDTKAAVVGTTFPANTLDVFGVTAYAGPAAPADWSAAPYFDNVSVNSGVASALTFATNQYYPANGDKVYFYAYAPAVSSLTAGTSSAAPVAAYTITGQQDIMVAQVTTGIAVGSNGVQVQPTFAFTHKLMQLRFKVVADVSYFESGKSKKVTEVLVKNVKNSAKLSIGDGVLAFDDVAADKTFTLPITTGTKDEITTGGTEMDGCVMSAPVGAAGEVMLKITADGVVYDNIVVILAGTNSGMAGTSHLITLTFKRSGIAPTATITDWSNTGSGSVDVGVPPPPPEIGEFKDGGVVYWVDPADATKYKVVSVTEAPTELKWAPENTYVIGAGAQSDTDSKGNTAAIKAYFEANPSGIIIESTFEAAFPAAAYCYNYQGKDGKDAKGSWYLPAKTDLQYLWCAFNGKAPISWDSGNNASAPADATAQAKFNKYLTDADGEEIISGSNFGASTEHSSSTSHAWDVKFSDGSTHGNGKGYDDHVRCVKNITPPTVGDFCDGGIVYQVTDAKHYKIFSLGQGVGLGWSAQSTDMAAQDVADGKKNIETIKAYFAANGATVGTDFSVAFPAAAFCDAMNTGGVTGWYLPAKNELIALCDIYQIPANKTAIDAGLNKHSGAAFHAGDYWSSSEINTEKAWSVSLRDGSYNSDLKHLTSYTIRCVKEK